MFLEAVQGLAHTLDLRFIIHAVHRRNLSISAQVACQSWLERLNELRSERLNCLQQDQTYVPKFMPRMYLQMAGK